MARPEEVRREGWKAKRLVRIPPPPPIRKTYAEATAAAAASASADEMARDLGGGDRREDMKRTDLVPGTILKP